ncbi:MULTISPECIES: MaoC/PaaZ C-terminal domain-containing protein [unclassified Variovorax]|uniref:MaoC family dehydratase n=1 Tax=unclassified Variovorax TaxID=663243 RepID=UPI00076C2E79|nr:MULTISPECIES: MaoC/PaaZ C-terminal domain-containing protein [unclassified Variovorax]KWT74773.1 hypothetical protein APY03_5529 [Variovorax sp. WDL1]PNG46080.1 hypothetical protein CHC06_08058 [Variovorax sp. B2]PNG46261.1 hypothetical protein CHC07_08009 [Variovorax sp. B4]VTV19195.1 (3R)-hydroxyacyl-ACP dehydratase subunit HadB [Variovorax sp. WDL1]
MIRTATQARAIAPGTLVSSAQEKPLTRVEIAWYMVASYDLNPIHVDEPFAKEAGFKTVIGQGMLPLGYLSRMLVAEVGLERLRALSGDFVGLVFPGDELTLELRMEGHAEREGGVELEWSLTALGPDGKPRTRGRARSWHAESEEI